MTDLYERMANVLFRAMYPDLYNKELIVWDEARFFPGVGERVRSATDDILVELAEIFGDATGGTKDRMEESK